MAATNDIGGVLAVVHVGTCARSECRRPSTVSGTRSSWPWCRIRRRARKWPARTCRRPVGAIILRRWRRPRRRRRTRCMICEVEQVVLERQRGVPAQRESSSTMSTCEQQAEWARSRCDVRLGESRSTDRRTPSSPSSGRPWSRHHLAHALRREGIGSPNVRKALARACVCSSVSVEVHRGASLPPIRPSARVRYPHDPSSAALRD